MTALGSNWGRLETSARILKDVRTDMIPLMKSTFLHEREAKERLISFLSNSDKLSMGNMCEEFENRFADWQRAEFCTLFNSGGSANLAILQALKNTGRLQEGSRVGFSCLTWSTNVMPIIQLGMIPVPVDCDKRTLNSMQRNLEECYQEVGLDAFFLTNALGFSGDLSNISDYCHSRNILLIEDNCEALGAIQAGKLTGNYGVASSFSFFVAHHLSTIEGGMVATADEELSDMLRIVRANGWDRNLRDDKQEKLRAQHNIKDEFDSKYSFYDLGFNLRPTEITGFLGIDQLEYLDWNIETRIMNHKKLESVVKGNPDLTCVEYSHMDAPSPFAFPVVCRSEELREKYMRRFRNNNIEIRPMIAGNIQNQPFYRKYKLMQRSTPGAQFLDRCSFYCGNYPELTDMDTESIAECLA